MQWDWERVKEIAGRCFEKVGSLFLFQAFLGYLAACVTAGHPVGIAAYVSFLNHCCQWRGW
jgi:hypothetical protein